MSHTKDKFQLSSPDAYNYMNPNIGILILTGHHYPEYKEVAVRYGADGFLIKGGASKEILEMVESLFSNAEEPTIASVSDNSRKK